MGIHHLQLSSPVFLSKLYLTELSKERKFSQFSILRRKIKGKVGYQ
jgi:hypothetical protein